MSTKDTSKHVLELCAELGETLKDVRPGGITVLPIEWNEEAGLVFYARPVHAETYTGDTPEDMRSRAVDLLKATANGEIAIADDGLVVPPCPYMYGPYGLHLILFALTDVRTAFNSATYFSVDLLAKGQPPGLDVNHILAANLGALLTTKTLSKAAEAAA